VRLVDLRLLGGKHRQTQKWFRPLGAQIGHGAEILSVILRAVDSSDAAKRNASPTNSTALSGFTLSTGASVASLTSCRTLLRKSYWWTEIFPSFNIRAPIDPSVMIHNDVGSQARVDFGGANQPKSSEEGSRTC
jgi:hypothetical protein